MNSTNTNNAPGRWAASLVLMIFMLLLSSAASAQGKKLISGTINDNAGMPVPGASVIEVGASNSVSTDADGKFAIEVNIGSTVEISSIGFATQSIVVDASVSDTLTISLQEDTTMLDSVEIVAVGYGTMRRSDLTGAISTVSEKNLAQGNIPSTELVLQGKVAGLTVVRGSGDPASGGSLRLRGGTSLTANNNPLIVVDGIAGVDINIVQPADIKTVDVLKDASATAIYGSRGANGVIIITTKGGSKGAKGLLVNYNGFMGIAKGSNQLDMLSGNQWRQYVRDNEIADAIDYGGNTDWQKELEQTGFTQTHTLGITSNGENSGLRASISYINNEGIVKTTGLERTSVNVSNYQYALDRKIKFDVGLFANMDKWHPLDYRIFERAFNLNPTIPVRDASGKFTSVGGTLYENPVEILTNRTADSKRHRVLGYFKTEVNFFDGLQGVVNTSVEHNAMQGNIYKPSYAVLEGMTEGGYGQKTYGEYMTTQLEAYLSYNKVFDKHSIGAVAGYSYLENMYEGFGAQRSGFETDLFSYNNLGAGYNYRLGDVYSYKGKSNLVSFFGRANYAYDGKYMLTGTVRRDGSSRFGDNNKWGVFPSAAVAWKVSDEQFFSYLKENWKINTFKLRFGYGVTGNQDGIGEYKSLSILGVGQDSYYDPATQSWSLAYSPTQNPNPDLKWESTTQLNFGVDFGIGSFLTGSFEVYNKQTKDLLYTYQVPQPPYLVGTMLANVGELSNKGIELTLNASIIDNDKFTWNTNFVFAKNKQKIEKLSNQVYETDRIYSGSLHGLSGMSNQFSQIIDEGYAVGTFYGKQYLGQDADGAQILSEDDRVLGDVQPDFTLGFGMNFTYSSFDFGFSGYGMFGQDVLNATNMMLNDPNRMPAYNIPDDFRGSSVTSAPAYSSYWIEDASFFRLQNVTLGYTLPFKGSKLRLYVMGENLAVFTDYSGVDPEVDNTGLTNPGIDRFNNYPRPRTISFGLNLTLNH
jgi:TonB-dependent starch-binding outer membrane protein SusC